MVNYSDTVDDLVIIVIRQQEESIVPFWGVWQWTRPISAAVDDVVISIGESIYEWRDCWL